jgi:hypothetical protein
MSLRLRILRWGDDPGLSRWLQSDYKPLKAAPPPKKNTTKTQERNKAKTNSFFPAALRENFQRQKKSWRGAPLLALKVEKEGHRLVNVEASRD